ncbi:caspase-1-like isoform X1 [Formica exsecta]|uniref:caspase-1-like isoform X1 n=1 Tax=Formica exsecta TaxID=72781 RepID=UPI0011422D46|nr:caspase-1-like isoform X1 [Formica exsecta]
MLNSKLKQRINLKFLVKLKKNSLESLRLLKKVYGRECMSRARILKLHKQFTDSVDEDKCHARPSTWKTVENVTRIKEIVRKDSCMTMDNEIFIENVESSNISSEHRTRSSSVIDSIGIKDLFTIHANIAVPCRSKSLSTLDHYTTPEEDQKQNFDKPDIAERFKPDTEKSDLIDANIFPNIVDDDNLIGIQYSTSTAFMPVPIDADRYNMNHKNRGKCIIFNHEEFDSGIDKREGSTTDAMRLQKSFGNLGFDIEIENDLSHMEVMDKIEKLSQYDHTDNDCLCIIVLTHGLQNDLIWAKDVAYKSEKIWKPFTADKCITLAGKPKLFFFQACRGDQVDSGVVLSPRSLIPSEATDTVSSYKIPTHADFLIAHSSVQDFYTWRNPVEGTWYIQCLCKVLDEYGTKMDLMSMLTLTARKVATDFASINPIDKTMHDKKQVPSATSMLIRSVYFPPKLNEQSTTT